MNATAPATPPTEGLTPEQPSPRSPWLALAAAGTAVAGGLHLAAAVEHVDAGDLAVAFFGLVGFGQLAAAVALLVPLVGPTAARTRTLLAAAGLVATAALLALYVLAHSTDLFGTLLAHPDTAAHHSAGGGGHPIATDGPVSLGSPPPATVEPAGGLGTATVAAEVLALSGYLALLPAVWRRRSANLLLLVGGLAWVSWLSGILN